MTWTEFYPEKQGRPGGVFPRDMEADQLVMPPGYISGILIQASYSTITKTDNYTASTRTLILVDASSKGVVISLKAASTNTGRYYIIKKIDASSNSVVVKGNASTETIDGETSITMKIQYQYITVACDGFNWHIIGGEYVKLEDLLEEKLDAVVDGLDKLLIEARQGKLHLASLSQEDIDEEDVND